MFLDIPLFKGNLRIILMMIRKNESPHLLYCWSWNHNLFTEIFLSGFLDYHGIFRRPFQTCKIRGFDVYFWGQVIGYLARLKFSCHLWKCHIFHAVLGIKYDLLGCFIMFNQFKVCWNQWASKQILQVGEKYRGWFYHWNWNLVFYSGNIGGKSRNLTRDLEWESCSLSVY